MGMGMRNGDGNEVSGGEEMGVGYRSHMEEMGFGRNYLTI